MACTRGEVSQAAAVKRIEREIAIANECFAQAGIRILLTVEFAPAPPRVVRAGGKVQLASPIAPRNNLTVEQLTKEQREILALGANTASTTDIEVYYTSNIEQNKTYPRGFSLPKDWVIDATVASQINDSIFMSSSTKYYTLAHEMMHILLQVSLHPKKPTVLLAGASTEVFVEARTLITDTKRLDDINTRTILASKYVAQPE